MSVIDVLLEKYNGMDPVQRQNFWFVIAGLIVIILLIISLGNTFEAISGFLRWGGDKAGGVVGGLENVSKTVQKP